MMMFVSNMTTFVLWTRPYILLAYLATTRQQGCRYFEYEYPTKSLLSALLVLACLHDAHEVGWCNTLGSKTDGDT